MSTLVEILYNIIGPIFIIVGIAALADRTVEIDPRSLSRLIIYVFTPFLIIKGIAYSDLGAGEAGKVVTIAILSSLLVALVAWIAARTLKFDQKLESAFVLSATLINAGNYGIPLNRFAFGAPGEERALLFFLATLVITYTLGVFLASRGTVSTRAAALRVFRVPFPYAVALGFLINIGEVDVPLPLERVIDLLSSATIPAMLVVLGVQLSRAAAPEQLACIRERIRPIVAAAGMRLVVAPAIALVLAVLLGLSGLARQVSIIQAAMPTAVSTGVLATEFGADGDFVAAVILVSTLSSVVTLSVLLSLLM